MDDPEIIIEKRDEEPPKNASFFVYSSSDSSGKGLPWKARLALWGMLLGGVAVGTLLFLFFITAFLYIFLPALLVLLIWRFLTRKL